MPYPGRNDATDASLIPGSGIDDAIDSSLIPAQASMTPLMPHRGLVQASKTDRVPSRRPEEFLLTTQFRTFKLPHISLYYIARKQFNEAEG